MNCPVRTGKDSDEARARIMEAAEEQFRRVGWTSVADIAAELGMSPANIYRFFPSRDAINESICGRVVNEVADIAFAIARTNDVKEVGRRLGVRYVLEGSVRKASGKVRIAGQLIDAITGAHIWADRFERDLTDIFALQDEVTVAVVLAIEPKLLQTEIAMAARRRPENLTAYDFYLRALPQYYLTSREGLAEAIRLADRALELDAGFGFVAVLAGVCHMQSVLWGY